MYNNVEQINLLDGLNINPIPLEVSQTMTTTKWLMAIQAKVNEAIAIRNDIMKDASDYVDSQFNKLNAVIEEFKTLINTVDILPDNSIKLKKMANDFIEQINDLVVSQIENTPKMLTFGINDDGYFYASIPAHWNEIQFNTNQDGNLILEY